MKVTMRRVFGLAASLLAAIVAVCWQTETQAANSKDTKTTAASSDQPDASAAKSWDQKAAAAYLDQRAGWWMGWQRAQRDHDTFCVSCHTAVPYAMSRPALRNALAEQGLPRTNENCSTMWRSASAFGKK